MAPLRVIASSDLGFDAGGRCAGITAMVERSHAPAVRFDVGGAVTLSSAR